MTRALQIDAERALLLDEHGRFPDAFLPVSGGEIPHALLVEDGKLLWTFRDTSGVMRAPRPASGHLLDEFLRIEDEDGVLAFARRRGVLAICRHGLPASHSRRSFAAPPRVPFAHAIPAAVRRPCMPERVIAPDDGLGYYAEPVERWLHFIRQSEAIVRTAAALGEDTIDPALWRTVYEDKLRDEPVRRLLDDHLRGDDRFSQLTLEAVIDEWLLLGDVRPRVVLGEQSHGSPGMELVGGTFGLLAIQLAITVARSGHVAICTYCPRPYFPTRKPRAGERNSCGREECVRAQNRDRQRRHRTR